jgi:hypothetical protein
LPKIRVTAPLQPPHDMATLNFTIFVIRDDKNSELGAVSHQKVRLLTLQRYNVRALVLSALA